MRIRWKWDKDAISKPCKLFGNTRSSFVHNIIIMRGVLSIYIFERYQSSEILIKENYLHCHGRVISTHQLYLAVRPHPPTFDRPTPLRSFPPETSPYVRQGSSRIPNFPSVPQGYLSLGKTSKPLWESELPANCHSAALPMKQWNGGYSSTTHGPQTCICLRYSYKNC